MNSVQIAEETFVCADPAEVGRAVADPRAGGGGGRTCG
jgi:hypothetical protein